MNMFKTFNLETCIGPFTVVLCVGGLLLFNTWIEMIVYEQLLFLFFNLPDIPISMSIIDININTTIKSRYIQAIVKLTLPTSVLTW